MAEYVALASVDDVKAALGRDLTSSEALQVADKLKNASELFRSAAGRNFTPGRREQRLKVNGGEVRLTESPVVTIHSVTDDDGNPISFTRFGVTIDVGLRSDRFVRVDYSYGADDVPELARTTVAGMVARTFNVDDRAKAGLAQFQTSDGPFADGGTFASWAVGGQVMMSPADTLAAQTFRPRRLTNTVVLRG